MSKTIEIRIGDNGKVSINAHGFEGPECTKYTESLLERISGTITEDVKKPSYFGVNYETSDGGDAA